MHRHIILFCFILLLASCGDSGGGNNSSSKCLEGYNQTTLLDNIKNTLILPSEEAHQNKLASLTTSIETLTANPTTSNLTATKTAFKSAYLAFQYVAQYDFGPAETVDYRTSLNNFPADKTVIDNNLNTGVYNFLIEGTFDKGYPALDYLLYANDAATTVSNIQNNEKFKKYLRDIVTDMTARTTKVVNAWNGEFGTSFSSNTGTAAGTSLSQIINNWNKNYEITKRDRIGIPAGVLSVGKTNPMNVEAYYSGLSLELIDASIDASEALYNKIDVLLAHVNAQKGDKTLDATIKNQFALIEGKFEKVNGPLSQAVDNDKEDVLALYKDATQMVLYTKTDLPTALCISITYTENPSDSD